MKANFLYALLITALTSGCAKKVFYNIPEGTDYSQKSLLFLETKGHPLSETIGLTLKKINGIETEGKYSHSKVEFKPGTYEIEFDIHGTPGITESFALGMAGGTAAMNTYMLGTNRNKELSNIHKITFLPGYYYFASFKVNHNNMIIVSIEEL
jgi:hypothetical protein